MKKIPDTLNKRIYIFLNYILREFRKFDGLVTVFELMLAVLSSLRNSDRLILPSLSISASSRSGSIEPFRPVCCQKRSLKGYELC